MTKHKHYDVLIAIAEGREVERRVLDNPWETYDPSMHKSPLDANDTVKWRVKPITSETCVELDSTSKESEYIYVYLIDGDIKLAKKYDRLICKDLNSARLLGKVKLEALDD